MLADAITERGHEALEPEVQDPPFDVAWRGTDGTINVVEVKNSTPANQTAQLRRGLGQVLDYDHTLRQRGHAHANPSCSSKRSLLGTTGRACALHGVKLASPESIAQLF